MLDRERSRDGVWCIQGFLVGESLEITRLLGGRKYLLEEAEDEGKIWSCGGQEEGVSLSDIG